MLRKVFRPKRKWVTDDWRKLHLMICSPHQTLSGHQINKNEMGGVCGTYGGAQKCIQRLEGEPEGKRPYARPRCREENNIKIDFKDSVRTEMAGLAHNRDEQGPPVNSAMKLRVSLTSGNFLAS